MSWEDTGLPWVLPSPNLPTVESCRVYPGMVLVEGTNLSEGRGTTKPFELFGAPFLDPTKLAGPGTALTELLVHAGLAPSKGQARKDIEGGGIYVNNIRVEPSAVTRALTTGDLLFGKYVLLRKGKRTYAVLNAAA